MSLELKVLREGLEKLAGSVVASAWAVIVVLGIALGWDGWKILGSVLLYEVVAFVIRSVFALLISTGKLVKEWQEARQVRKQS